MNSIGSTSRGLTLPAIVTLVLLTVLAALVAGASAVSAQGSAPDAPDRPVGTAVFIGGVDLEWNEVPGADSYGVQMYRNGQWTDLPGDGIEIAFYGAGAIINELEPEGSSYWFRVRAGSAHGFSEWSDYNFMASTNESKSGRQVRPENVPASGEPVINGTAQVGESLTADTSDMEDGNGLDRVKFRFQWVSHDGSADTDIANATESTYTLVADDAGKTIKVRVAFTDRGGYAESLTGGETATVAARPNSPPTGAPAVTGTAQVGETLAVDTTDIADADGLNGVTFSYQWVANDGTADTDITDATASTYILVAADEGKTIKVEVSFTDDAGNGETLTSAATSSVAARPNSAATGAPTISGTAHVEETLTAGTSGIGDADGLTNVSYNYQWIANDGTSDTDITGATASTYILVAADEGKTIKVRVSFTDDAANDEILTSTETEAVGFAVQQQIVNNPATGAPTISGAAQVGEALTADTSGIADTDGLVNATFRYQWMRNDGTSETDIQNATGSTYTLVDNDEGQTIKVKVSFTDDAGNDETLSSGATDAVAAPECDNIGDCDIEDVDDLLLPDLVSYQHDYSVAEVVATPDGTEFFALRFAGFVTNLGDGPLDLRGNPQLADDADLTSHDVWQRALTIDGDWVNLTKPPIDFEVDDGHDHFHVMGIVEYSLWDTSGTVEISSGAKIGFCLIDVMERPDLHANPGPKRHEQWDPDNYFCQSGRPRAKILHMGISEGWQDIYSFSETFQWIDVSDVQPGYYRIGQRADPDNVIVESDETNNELVLTQRLQVVPGYVARPEMVSVEPDAAVRFKLSVDEYFDDTNLEDGSPRTRAHRIVTQPSHGSLDVGDTVTVIVDGATHQVFTDEWVTYTPDPGYAGVDSFTFVALDDSRPRYPINPVVATVTLDITGAPTIRGTAQVGETLTADTSGIGDTDSITGISYSYQWVRNDGTNYTDIPGATDPTYTMVAADEGRTIKVRVSFTDDAGNEETLTSAATSSVTARPEQGIAPNAPDLPIGTAVFVGGVDLEWNEVPVADSYEVQLYQNGQWIDLPGDGVEIAFYGAGAIISGLDPSLTLWFQVRARNAHGSSDWSDFSSLSSTNQFTLGKRARSANEAARGAPVINGTAQVGEILTADTTGIEDENGLDRVQFRFQWATNDGSADTDIAGATNSTYTLAGSDEGKTIKVRVAFIDRGGYAESLTSDATETVSFAGQQQIANNPATGGPIIGGTARVGETLATDVLGIADEDGLENATFSYQWISNDGTTDADIQGETGATYTLAAADEGQSIKVRVSFTDDADNEETLTSAPTATVAARPNQPATGAPIIGGTVRVGETLATDVLGIADEDGLENATFSYQWISNDGTTDADIQGETGATYTLASAYVGKTIKVKVTFTDDADNEETLTSPATAEVAAGVPTDPPAKPRNLTGTANADGTVTLRWDAPDDDSVTGYQILRRRPTEGERTLLVHVNDTGSTATEYTDNDVTLDVLHTYRVTTINAVGLSRRSEFVNVTPTQPAEPAQNAPATGTLTISGNAQVGETLTADTSGISDADGLTNVTFSYQWIGNDGSTDTDIQHATGSSYTLVEADEGQTIKVKVSFADDADNRETLTSTATAAVAAPEPPAKPTGLSAAVISHDTVTITWDDPQDDAITGYIILRRDREIHPVGTFITITGDTGSADTTYTDDTVEPDKQYNYKVKAINEHGEVSERSDWVRANTPAVPVPDKPTGLSAAVSHDAVTLTWDDPQDDSITGYVILRRDRAIHPTGTFVTIAGDTGSAQTAYTDETVEPDKKYVYRIKAINDRGLSEMSLWLRTDTPNWATGAPTIGGNAQVGETLTAGISEIADEDGLENAVFSYQWVASNGTTDTNIAAATDSTYDLVAADAGKTIKVRVSFTDDAGNEETLTSTATDIVSFAVQLQTSNSPATGAPVIAGTIQVGETLTADTSSISDADGLTNVSYQYQWLRNDGSSDADITGATDSTYALADDDEGNTVKVRVSFTDDQDNDESLISPATASVSAQQTPAGPTRLYVGVRAEGMALSWRAPVGTEVEGYRILRKTVGHTEMETLVDNTGSTELSYLDSDVQHLSTYEYQVVGLTGSTETEASAVFPDSTREALVWEDPRAPRPRGVSSGEEGMTLRWWPPTHGWGSTPTGYQILRRNITAGEAELQVYVDDTGSTGRTFTDPNVEYKNQYVYSVRARSDEGLSLESQSASATYAHALMEEHPYEPPQNEDSPVEHARIAALVGLGYGPDGRTWELDFAVGPLVPDDDPTTKDYIINYRIVDEDGDPLPDCEGDGLGISIHFWIVSDVVGGNQHSAEVGLNCTGAYFALIEVLDANSNFIDRNVINVSP